VTPVVAVSSGAKVLLHEARIIATKERTEMKIIEFFIAGKIVVESAGHSITNRRDPRDTNEGRRVSERERTHQSKPSESMYLYPQTHMVIECVPGGNGRDGNRAT